MILLFRGKFFKKAKEKIFLAKAKMNKNLKILIVGVAFLVSLTALIFLAQNLIFSNKFNIVKVIVVSLLFIITDFLFFAAAIAFQKNFLLLIILLGSILSGLAIGMSIGIVWPLIVSVVFLVFGIVAALGIQSDNRQAIKFNFGKILKRGNQNWYLALSFVIAVLFFVSPLGLNGKLQIPKPIFNSFIASVVEKAFQTQYSADFKLSSTVNEFINAQVDSQVDQKLRDQLSAYYKTEVALNAAVTNYKSTPAGKAEIAAVKTEALQSIGEQFGMTLTGNENLGDVLLAYLNNNIDRSLKQYTALGDWAVVIVLALTIKWILSILDYIFIPIEQVLFLLAKRMKIFTVSAKMVQKEELVI